MPTTKNIYDDDIDFAALALQDADFAKILKPNGQLDFSSPEAVQQLTKSLLKRDFGLRISLPPDRLCPPVPNRFNYILWIQSLLDSTSDSYRDVYDPHRDVLGLDIGTGASCIYPLLGCSQRPRWRFAGTDIDEKSLQFARQNVQANGLQSRIRLFQSQPSDQLIPLNKMGFESVDFTMCNPPFYESEADLLSSAVAKKRPPFTACTGSEGEMVTPGGEFGFISRMIDESLIIQARVQWYTSMLGKFSNVALIVQQLRDKGLGNYAVTEFVQGSRTKRWGIAWSFNDLRPSMSIARGVGSLQKALLPFPSEYLIILNSNPSEVGQYANDILSELALKWTWKSNISTGVGFSEKAIWSRAARRHAAKSQEESMEEYDVSEMAFGFKIHAAEIPEKQGCTKVTIRWIKGHDIVLFDSFCGMLKRKIVEAVKGNRK